MLDIAARLGLPVLLVVGIRLGCLNHALLTAQAIRARGLELAGWVANRIDPAMPEADGERRDARPHAGRTVDRRSAVASRGGRARRRFAAPRWPTLRLRSVRSASLVGDAAQRCTSRRGVPSVFAGTIIHANISRFLLARDAG